MGLVVSVSAAGCASDGRELANPSPDQTTTTRPLPPTSAPDQEISETGFALTSPDFDGGADAPLNTTCAGANVFPNLVWSEPPPSTAEIAVTLTDQTNPEEPLLLWLMAGISPGEDGLDAGTMAPGAFETLNDYGNLGYGTPCLENLEPGQHDLQFRVYLLEHSSDLSAGDPGNEAIATLQAAAVDSASLLMRIDATG
jgi:phosphatidylethanolamine-binding protein (PEBP) family uncharacterized protein